MDEEIGNTKTPALLIGHGLPPYSEIDADHVKTYIPLLLEDLNKRLTELEKDLEKKLASADILKWHEVLPPLHQLGEKLRWSWGAVSHLNSVCNSPEFREAHSKQQPEIIRFGNRIGQSKILHRALCKINEKSLKNLDSIQKRILKAELLSMQLRGVGLDDEIKNEFNVDSEQLAELSTTFSNQLLDATKKWGLLLKSPSEVDGLPNRTKEALASAARDHGDRNTPEDTEPTAEKGPWRLGLDMPTYISFITHATNRRLREIIYKAYVKRASEGELNNQPLIEKILILRTRQAQRLGYSNWADLSLASKMAKDINAVETLLEDLRLAAKPTAHKELKELQEFAWNNGAPKNQELAPWDIAFWSERLKKERFDLDQEALRPWFPLPQVLEGLFTLCGRLFDISVEAADGEAPIWHKDVRFFKVHDKDGSAIAAFYLDPYSRPKSKRGGAWMDECLVRSQSSNGEKTLPVAYLICNQTPPGDNTPSLMSFEEVETLFHEFGHGLQHMLTTVDYPQAAGINNVEWDAVELPSQFMENWCIDRTTLMGIAKHWKTGDALPEKEFEKLNISRKFNAGLTTLRQVHFALTDMRLHSQWNKSLGVTPDQLRRQIAISTTVLPPIPEDKFLCSFGHIFSGGYAAGYYSYKWAEVLSADAFSAFEEAGLDQEEKIKAIGKRFRETVLSLGGSIDPAEVFIAFRGRPSKTDALIRHSGLTIIDNDRF